MSRSNAFTLVEIILVVVIIALLATLVMPRLVGKSEQARRTAAAAQIIAFKTALSDFEFDCYRYPNTAEGLKALVEKPVGLAPGAKWKRYLDDTVIPKDPWGNEYIYRNPGTVNTDGYDLLSPGPDGKEGADDDVGNTTRRPT